MSSTDWLLGRRRITLPTSLSLAECHERIGPDAEPSGLFGSGDKSAAYCAWWHGDDFVRLTKRMSLRGKGPRGEVRARFVQQPTGTDVEVTAGMMPTQVLSYAFIWAVLAVPALANLTTTLHSSTNGVVGIGFAVFAMPAVWLGSRAAATRQADSLVTALENALETSALDSPVS